MTQIFPPIRNRKKSKLETWTLRAHPCVPLERPSVQSLVGDPGLQTWWRGEGSSLSFQGVPLCIWCLWNYCPTCILTRNSFPTSPSSEDWTAFPRGLFLQLCCYFPFLDQGRLWALVLRQGHPFASLTVPGEEVVIAPREGSLPAPDIFYPILALQMREHKFVCEPLSTQGTPLVMQ